MTPAALFNRRLHKSENKPEKTPEEHTPAITDAALEFARQVQLGQDSLTKAETLLNAMAKQDPTFPSQVISLMKALAPDELETMKDIIALHQQLRSTEPKVKWKIEDGNVVFPDATILTPEDIQKINKLLEQQ